jgi:transcriptional regulator with XRE-family HTH domain
MRRLGLSQVEFGRLFDVHFMTVSKWERDVLSPSPYQIALMQQFDRALKEKRAKVQEELKHLLVGAGVIAALVFLLTPTNR